MDALDTLRVLAVALGLAPTPESITVTLEPYHCPCGKRCRVLRVAMLRANGKPPPLRAGYEPPGLGETDDEAISRLVKDLRVEVLLAAERAARDAKHYREEAAWRLARAPGCEARAEELRALLKETR